MKITDDDTAKRRKFAARRFNEHVKLLAAAWNTIGLTIFGSALVLPTVSGKTIDNAIVWIIVAGGLHISAHCVLRLLRSED
ncbi:hypothetical protein [Fulvimarina sp. MAC3]|uniref:hypothetical protein n=1 Tax=Fulvimarina sp. MAC3 TaxID=3148887 RepID=UPI0031FCFB88